MHLRGTGVHLSKVVEVVEGPQERELIQQVRRRDKLLRGTGVDLSEGVEVVQEGVEVEGLRLYRKGLRKGLRLYRVYRRDFPQHVTVQTCI